MTNKRLVWYLEKEKKLDDRQLDFRNKEKKHNRRYIKNNNKNSQQTIWEC